MKILENILKISVFILLIISSIYFLLSVFNFLEQGNLNFEEFYSSISEYSGIHKFMFLVLAGYLGLRRLKLSYENHQKTLDQLKLTENEIFRKRETDTNSKTLEHCEFYLNEIQIQFKDLIQNKYYQGIPLIWSNLGNISREELMNKYKVSYQKFIDAEKGLKSESLLTLYKLEAFAANFLIGNTDLELGKEIIGDISVKQVGYLLGLIAFYRTEDNENLFSNILELKNKWE